MENSEQDGLILDPTKTTSLAAVLLTYNGELDHFGLSRVDLDFTAGGTIEISQSTSALRMDMYRSGPPLTSPSLCSKPPIRATDWRTDGRLLSLRDDSDRNELTRLCYAPRRSTAAAARATTCAWRAR